MENAGTSHPIDHPPLPTPKPSSRCSQCNAQPKEHGRNLVVCIDGTSNRFGQNNTNVVKLLANVNQESDKPKQIAYYSSGIGTRPESKFNIFSRAMNALADSVDMAIAWNVEEIVKDAYSWLVRMYQDGDQIYLFGFSRGAYQVRVLAQMIHEVGLIRTLTDKQIGTAYGHYKAIRPGNLKETLTAREFKNTFSWKDLRVHFVGVWDTVSSVGLVKEDVFLSTSSSAAHTCYFRHALALDEHRVKFMPEYFQEMNSRTVDEKSKCNLTCPGGTNSTSGQHTSILSDSCADLSEGKKKSCDVKEVWFAGCHSDVGGMDNPGKIYQAGNVSLLWMRREAAANGLSLKPTDIVWTPVDLDFGINNSMTFIWRFVEYLPMKHQVSFSGAGGSALRLHRLGPRRIIPGQKVHASVLHANTYKPKATLGEGFDIPAVQPGVEATELDNKLWETGLFDDTAAQELVTYLGSQQSIAPITLYRLLFMLRFEEGRQCVRNVPDWQAKFMEVINDHSLVSLVRLVTIVAYYEASCDPKADLESLAPSLDEVLKHIFDDLEKCLRTNPASLRLEDVAIVPALLKPLTEYQTLSERLLTDDVLDILVQSLEIVGRLDVVVWQQRWIFGYVIDGLVCLLQCEHTQKKLVAKLEDKPQSRKVSGPSQIFNIINTRGRGVAWQVVLTLACKTLVRKLGDNIPMSDIPILSQILQVEDPYLLMAALRMVLTLARIPEAREMCTVVKPRIRELARKDKLVGPLAVEVLLVLYDPNDPGQLNICKPRVRTSVANALARINHARHRSADGQSLGVDPGQQTLCQLFGFDATQLSESHKGLIGELKKAVQDRNVRERTAATMTLVKLCEAEIIRTHLRDDNLLDVFIDQLQHKTSALLAAYALVNCLEYKDMKESIENNEDLSKHIVGMLELDYFDDAIGHVEGFQIFGDLMKHACLREQIKEDNIIKLLSTKLEKGKSNETRTSLICLDILQSLDLEGTRTKQLVEESLEHLKKPVWKDQKVGVTILFALAQTEHGANAIIPHIPEIVQMSASGLPSSMMGPVCALRILAQNETLRKCMHETKEYGKLRHLYLSGALVGKTDTASWRVKTPTQADVINMLDKTIKTVDDELPEGLMSIGDAVLPHIRHWDRLAALLGNWAVSELTTIAALLGVSVLAVLTLVLFTPTYLSVRVYAFFKRLLSRHQDGHGSISSQGAEEAEQPRLQRPGERRWSNFYG